MTHQTSFFVCSNVLYNYEIKTFFLSVIILGIVDYNLKQVPYSGHFNRILQYPKSPTKIPKASMFCFCSNYTYTPTLKMSYLYQSSIYLVIYIVRHAHINQDTISLAKKYWEIVQKICDFFACCFRCHCLFFDCCCFSISITF